MTTNRKRRLERSRLATEAALDPPARRKTRVAETIKTPPPVSVSSVATDSRD